jgi:hypothetical protein
MALQITDSSVLFQRFSGSSEDDDGEHEDEPLVADFGVSFSRTTSPRCDQCRLAKG